MTFKKGYYVSHITYWEHTRIWYMASILRFIGRGVDVIHGSYVNLLNCRVC